MSFPTQVGRRDSSTSSGKASRVRMPLSPGTQSPCSPSSSATSSLDKQRDPSSLISLKALFEKAKNSSVELKIKLKDHELDYVLHLEDCDGEYGIHEKLLRPRKKDRVPSLSMGNQISNRRRMASREAGSRDGSPASVYDNRPGPRCKKQNYVASDDEGEVDDYVVSRIKTAKLTDEGPKFFVQWLNYPCEDTWEPYDNCGDCAAMDYFERWWPTIGEEDASEVLSAFQLFVKRNLDPTKSCDIAVLLRMSETKLKDLSRNRDEIEAQKHELIKKIKRIYYPLIHYQDYGEEGGSKMKTNTLVTLATKRLGVQNLNEIMDLKEKRLDASIKLAELKVEINDSIRTLQDGPPVEIENLVDADVFKPFNYVRDYHVVDVAYDDQTCITCNCVDRCGSDSCPCLNDYPRAYDEFKTIKIDPGKPIYECNPRCSCGLTCKMRVISDGRKFRLCIFKTDDGRGWGLKTLELIPKGRFVVHYSGELMTVSASEKREAERSDDFYNRYIFALDYAPVDGLEENVIDANDFGNLSRFINHSCKPNMDSYVSWSNNLNPNTPTIAFFSKTEILPGTELTFDYKADIFNRNELKGLGNTLFEDDQFFFGGDPSARFVPGQPKDVEKGSITGSSNDENDEFARRKGKRSRKPTAKAGAPAPKPAKRQPKPPHLQHHLTSEFHQKCFCGTKRCRVYMS